MLELDSGLTTIMWTGVVGAVVYLIKRVLIDALKGKSEAGLIIASDDMLGRYRAEILRLEGIIQRLQARVDELETRFDGVHLAELQDAADIAELTILIESMSCESSERMIRILDRFRKRMAEKRSIAHEARKDDKKPDQ